MFASEGCGRGGVFNVAVRDAENLNAVPRPAAALNVAPFLGESNSNDCDTNFALTDVLIKKRSIILTLNTV